MLNVDQEILYYGRGGYMENELILASTKKSIGIPEDDDHFDTEIRMHVLSALMTLNQAGVGIEALSVSDNTKWLDFKNSEQENGNKYFALVPQYVFLRTKLIFDPPPPSNVQFYNEMIKEILWRLKRAYGEVQNA